MTAKIKIRMNSAGAVAVLNSPGVQASIASRAGAISAAASKEDGASWPVSTFKTDRPNATVRTGNREAMKASAENHALMRALDAGR